MTPDWLMHRPIAHRGLHDASAGVIENTLAAAEAAVAAGFAIECDVQLSRDGEAFVFHDFTLDRLTDRRGALIEFSAAEIRKASFLPGGEGEGIPAFAELLALVAGRTPIVCELKSRFDRNFRIADRVAVVAEAYEGPLALKSFDPDLIAYLRLRWPRLGPPGRLCPAGIVAEASYDGPDWDELSDHQKRDWTTFEHYDRARPDFLSWNVDDLPHAIPFFVREMTGAPVMAWTVRGAAQREAARKWADQIVFEGAGRP